jgi:hypothetical protein
VRFPSFSLFQSDEWLSGIGESNQVQPPAPTADTQQVKVLLGDSLRLHYYPDPDFVNKILITFQSCSSEVLEVWSCSQNRTDIDLDAAKIKQVKSVMASITLPETSIPQWASAISEEQWKEQLLVRIKKMQNKES